MKKLGKKLETTMDTIEAYCACDPSLCQTHLGDYTRIVSWGIHEQVNP